MTMRELAAIANVSVSTVSKAFHDADDVSDETKKLIFATAKEYGCFGKYYKGRFSKKVIAIICPELNSAYYNGYVRRLQNEIEKNGAIAVISSDHFSIANQAELIDYYASFLRVDGLFVFNLRTSLKKGYNIPIISLLGNTDNTVDSVQVDYEPAIKEAVTYLNGLGHREIAFIGEKLTIGKERLFLSAAEGLAGKYYAVRSSYRFGEAGADGIRQVLDSGKRPTAIVCAYDDMAIGAIRYLHEKGYSIPEDMSVIGMDNIEVAKYMEHSLTSIDTSPDEVCALAWDLLQKKMKNCYYRLNQKIVLSGKLVIRDSTGAAQK